MTFVAWSQVPHVFASGQLQILWVDPAVSQNLSIRETKPFIISIGQQTVEILSHNVFVFSYSDVMFRRDGCFVAFDNNSSNHLHWCCGFREWIKRWTSAPFLVFLPERRLCSPRTSAIYPRWNSEEDILGDTKHDAESRKFPAAERLANVLQCLEWTLRQRSHRCSILLRFIPWRYQGERVSDLIHGAAWKSSKLARGL